MPSTAPFKPQVIVITGAASGIGRALALQAHRLGHTVYATDLKLEPMADLLALGLRTCQLDVTSEQDIAALIRRLEADGAAPDLLVNNAGFGAIAPMAEISMASLRAQFEVNVFGLVALCQAVIPGMVARRSGRIVNIGSVSGIVATPFAGAYCASKSAVHALSDSMRMELAPFGVQVIVVQPGAVRSDFGAAASKGAASATLPGSLYAAVAAAIDARAHAGQVGAITAEDFATQMFEAVLAERPKPAVRIGPQTRLLPFMKRYLPTATQDYLLSNKFQLKRLRK